MTTQPAVTPKPAYTQRDTCRACHAARLIPVLDLGNQYLANFVPSRDEKLPRAPLELVRCGACGLLQLLHSIDGDLMWRGDYWYRSSINQTMRDALQDVVNDGHHFAREGAWLDIGANDGYLLSRVGERFTKVGCEPAMNMQPLLEEHADKIIPDYFTADRALAQADMYEVVTSCAMFYDLDDPLQFCRDVARILSPNGVWINQFSDAPTMLERNAWDAICHEHVCYYDVPTLEILYEKAGLHVISISHNEVNGGSVRVAAVKARTRIMNPMLGIKSVTDESVAAFADRVARWKPLMQEILDRPSVKSAELWGLGASTKGCCQLQYLDMSDRFIAIGDRNPSKVGTFMAGTWIPVVDEATMRQAKPKTVYAAIWAFRDEVMAREAALRAGGATIVFPLPNIELVT